LNSTRGPFASAGREGQDGGFQLRLTLLKDDASLLPVSILRPELRVINKNPTAGQVSVDLGGTKHGKQ
jgi:hypothetical protein